MTNPPTLIAINHDSRHANHIGHTDDGRQFFLTTPFIPATPTAHRKDFIALYIFTPDGQLLEIMIDELGPRSGLDEDKARLLYNQRLADLGNIRFDRITIAPFTVNGFGTQFGLIPRAPENESDPWVAELQPGNYMAFFEPFDSGEYHM